VRIYLRKQNAILMPSIFEVITNHDFLDVIGNDKYGIGKTLSKAFISSLSKKDFQRLSTVGIRNKLYNQRMELELNLNGS
jgi:hypothetical protein